METKPVAVALPLRHWSANSWEIDRDCSRKGFYHSCYGGTGIQLRAEAATKAPELVFGGAYHLGLAAIRRFEGLPAALLLLHKELESMPPEQRTLWAWVGEGLLRSWEKVNWPVWQNDYNTQNGLVELKLADPATGLVAIVDWVIEGPEGWVYVEDKTTSSIDAKWLTSWDRKVQLMSGPHTLRVMCGIDVSWSIVQGHYKGYWQRDRAAGTKTHAGLFSHGWYRGTGFDGLPIEWSPVRPQHHKGWNKAPAWEVYPSPEVMVDSLAERQRPLLEQLFVQTFPIQVQPSHVARWLRQAEAQEALKKAAAAASAEGRITEEDLDVLFPMNTSKCDPRWEGDTSCPFVDLCFNSSMAADPLGSGIYVKRDTAEWGALLGKEL